MDEHSKPRSLREQKRNISRTNRRSEMQAYRNRGRRTMESRGQTIHIRSGIGQGKERSTSTTTINATCILLQMALAPLRMCPTIIHLISTIQYRQRPPLPKRRFGRRSLSRHMPGVTTTVTPPPISFFALLPPLPFSFFAPRPSLSLS